MSDAARTNSRIVGEQGPEIIVPVSAGVVLRMDKALDLWLLNLMRHGVKGLGS